MQNDISQSALAHVRHFERPESDKEMVFNFYLSLFEKNGAKHNHKEASAWGGLLLYAAFCCTLISSSFSTDAMPTFGSRHDRLLWCGALLLTLTVLTGIMERYLHNQLKLKDRASARIAAASQIISEILTQPHLTIEHFVGTSAPTCCDEALTHSGVGKLPKHFLETECHCHASEVKKDQAIKTTKVTVYGLLICTAIITGAVVLAKTGLPLRNVGHCLDPITGKYVEITP